MKTTPIGTPVNTGFKSFRVRNPENISGIVNRRNDYINQHQLTECLYSTKIPKGSGLFDKSLRGYYGESNRNKRRFNALINLAMVGTYPLTSISYPNLLISRGLLPGAENANAVLRSDGDILFSWSDNSGTKIAKSNDKVMLVTYFPATKEIVYTLHSATRGSCQAVLHINKIQGFPVDTWVGFVSHDERDAGDSVYAGRVNL